MLTGCRPEDCGTGVSCEHCEIFNNTYFDEHLQTAASGIVKEEDHIHYSSKIYQRYTNQIRFVKT